MSKKLSITRLTPAADEAARSRYHQFVDSSPQGILYCKTWWLDAVAPGSWEILLAENGAQIRAAWPLVFSKRRKAIVLPPLTQKLGILLAPSTAKYVRRSAEEINLSEALIDALPPGYRVQQRFHEAYTNWLAFHWRGFRQSTKYTYVFEDLSDEDALKAGMSTGCRQVLKKAEKLGVEAVEIEDLGEVYSILDNTFARQGKLFPYGLDIVGRIDAACRQNAGRRILLARDGEGNVHACDYLVYDQRCAVSLLQGAIPEFRGSGAQRLLDWRSIQFARTVSQRFDFEGSMVRGIEFYNREFGARQVPYFEIQGRSGSAAPASRAQRMRRSAANWLERLSRVVDA